MYLRSDLLIKAKRDTSKLVKVQRTVTKNGTTFTQDFWVSPSQVKATDKVVGNPQNSLPKMGSVPQPPKGVLDKKYLDSVSSDRAKALAYIKSCGVKWTESTHAGINWMRAMQAVKAVLNNGNPASQVSSQPGTKPTQNSQSKQQISPNSLQAQALINDATQKELDQCANGREKVVVLKKRLGQDNCILYAKFLGVTWNEHEHNAINNMRMSMALQQHFDTVDGTVSPSGNKGNVGAPKGNANAQKDVHTDELPVPANATQRQKNIISLINSIDSIDDIRAYTEVGMIPEDDVSRDYILEKLRPKWVIFKNAHNIGGSKTNKLDKQSMVRATQWNFATLMSDNLNIEGCKKDIINNGFSSWWNRFTVQQLTDPRNAVFMEGVTDTQKVGIGAVITGLNNAFSVYTTDEYNKYKTNLGYTGWDSEEYKKRFDLEKEGFVRYLRKITEANPETSDQVDAMVEQYRQLIEKVSYNPRMLQGILQSSEWDITEPSASDMSMYRILNNSVRTPGTASAYLKELNYQIENIPKALKSLGYSDTSIKYMLEDPWYNDSLSNMRVYDEQGNRTTEVIDLTTVINPDTGKPYFNNGSPNDGDTDFHSSRSNYRILEYIKESLYGTPESVKKLELTNRLQQLQAMASITQQQWADIKTAANEMIGVKIVQKQPGGIKEDVDTTNYQSYAQMSTSHDCHTEKLGQNPELDTIVANLNLAIQTVAANQAIASEVHDNMSSKLNDHGDNYLGNFSFYYPTSSSSTRDHRVYRKYAGKPDYTVDQFNELIDNQLNNTPTVSSDYLQNLIAYYDAKGNYDSDRTREIVETEGLSAVKDDNDKISVLSYTQHPLKDVLYMMSVNVCRQIPKMNSPRLEQSIAKKLDYIPYDFTTTDQPTISGAGKKDKDSSPGLKDARKSLYKAAHCTISVEDELTSLQMRKDFLKNWDYDGVSHPKIYSGPNSFRGADRRALFNSRFFRVNNSNMEQAFRDYAEQLGQTPEEHYHATSYGSTAGILGVTGGWKISNNSYVKAGRALGNGAYFGRKGGKSSVYCGDSSYSDLDSSANIGDNANGIYILAQLIHGNTGDTTVSNAFREYEIVVRSNKCILPHHFVDISCRNLGVNITRDTQGNYLDDNGVVTHDRYGKSVNMK